VHLQAIARDQPGTHFCKLAFAEIWKMVEEPLGKNELQNRVAQKLKPLVVEMMPLRLMPQRRVRQSFRQQERVAEFILQALFKWVHARSCG
jgi:hypothetical protein